VKQDVVDKIAKPCTEIRTIVHALIKTEDGKTYLEFDEDVEKSFEDVAFQIFWKGDFKFVELKFKYRKNTSVRRLPNQDVYTITRFSKKGMEFYLLCYKTNVNKIHNRLNIDFDS